MVVYLCSEQASGTTGAALACRRRRAPADRVTSDFNDSGIRVNTLRPASSTRRFSKLGRTMPHASSSGAQDRSAERLASVCLNAGGQ